MLLSGEATETARNRAHCYSAAVSNLQKLILAKFLNNLYFAVPLQTFFFFAKGLNMTEIMFLESMFLAGNILFEVPTGILGDRIGRKWSIICGAVLSLVAWIPWFLAEGMFLFAVSYFIAGIAIAFQSGSDQALIYDTLRESGRERDMQRFMGRYLGSMTLGTAVAALVGGFLASAHDLDRFRDLFLATAMAQAIGAFVLLSLRDPPHSPEGARREHEPQRMFRLFHDGLHLLLHNRSLQKICLLYIVTMPFSYVLIYVFQPYFVLAEVPFAWFGVAVFFASLFSLGAKMYAYKIEQWAGVDRGTMILTLLPGFLWLLMAFIIHPVFSVLLYIFNDASGNARDPVFADYVNRHIESRNRATVLSAISLMAGIYAMLLRPVIGYITDMRLQYGFIFMGLLIVCGALLFRLRDDDVRYGAVAKAA